MTFPFAVTFSSASSCRCGEEVQQMSHRFAAGSLLRYLACQGVLITQSAEPLRVGRARSHCAKRSPETRISAFVCGGQRSPALVGRGPEGISRPRQRRSVVVVASRSPLEHGRQALVFPALSSPLEGGCTPVRDSCHTSHHSGALPRCSMKALLSAPRAAGDSNEVRGENRAARSRRAHLLTTR